MVGVRRARHRVGPAHARPRRSSRVPSPHGRLCRNGGRRRPSDAGHRPRSRAAARHRPRHVRRRRRADRAREAHRARLPRALQGRAADGGADGAQSRLELPRRRAQRRVQHAGRRMRRLRRGDRHPARRRLPRLARRRRRAGSGGRARVSLRRDGIPSAVGARGRKDRCRSPRRGGPAGGLRRHESDDFAIAGQGSAHGTHDRARDAAVGGLALCRLRGDLARAGRDLGGQYRRLRALRRRGRGTRHRRER